MRVGPAAVMHAAFASYLAWRHQHDKGTAKQARQARQSAALALKMTGAAGTPLRAEERALAAEMRMGRKRRKTTFPHTTTPAQREGERDRERVGERKREEEGERERERERVRERKREEKKSENR